MKPPGMTRLVSEAAKKRFPPQMVSCKPVGLGTPCDGLIAPRLNGFIVAQCFTQDGSDLAEQLIRQGFLCGQPEKSGGHYKSC
jgi:endonuclease YncB( thermonuclease family)